jgi:nitroimidazol reductase NimA-like FMN-containing flavoprotein (pyridoxamine 5'-phosphate oxidase superfamily)
MRRKEKKIRNRTLIEEIINKAQVFRLGLCKDNMPYVLPMSFGYDGEFIYFHTAREGMKIEYMESNNQVCFELEHDTRVIPNDDAACNWTFSFYSVIGFGTVEELTDSHDRIRALGQIMKHYSNRDWDFKPQAMEAIRLWRISIASITGKQSKDKITI